MGGTKWTLIIRIIAAIYIIYLAVTLIMEIQKGAVTGGMLALGIIGIVAFFVFAVWAFVSSIKGLIKESQKSSAAENGEAEEEDQGLSEEEEKARIRAIAESTEEDDRHSLFARMQKFSSETGEVEDAAEDAAGEAAEGTSEETGGKQGE